MSRLGAALLAAVVGLLVGCGDGSQPSSVEWRNVSLDVPDGWYLAEEAGTHLTLANVDLRASGPDSEGDAQDGPPVGGEDGVVAMAFTYEPTATPDDWRRFVDAQDATLESDTRITLDGEVPATQLVFSYTTNGVPTREMVTVIPSRAIVVLSQPVPGPGEEDAPEVFLRHVDTFRQVLETADFGPPVLE